MRKKQLLLQNSALFAEIERKSCELEALNIRIEELNEAVTAIKSEKEALEQQLEAIKEENQLLRQENEVLLAQQDNISPEKETSYNTDTLYAEENSATPSQTDSCGYGEADGANPQPLEENLQPLMEDADQRIISHKEPQALDEDIHTEPVIVPAKAKTTHLSKAEVDLLRTHGAQLIGKITRLTAQMLTSLEANGDENSEALKNLALGKNESFKYQILSLINTNGEINVLKAKMDTLAEEAANYLESYKNA